MIARSVLFPAIAGVLLVLGAAPARPDAPPAPRPSAATPSAPPPPTRITPSAVLRTAPREVQVEPVADSTWVLRAGTANVLAALTAEGWILVDTGTRAEAMSLREEVQRLAVRPIVAVFNTHFHDDHAGGNVVYRGMKVPVYASAATVALEQDFRAHLEAGAPREIARLDSASRAAPPGDDRERVVAFYDFLARWWREGLAQAQRDPRFVVPADQPFERALTKVIGGLRVEARVFPAAAHSAGDAVVAFPSRGVIAVGDVTVKGGAPWADQFMGGGSLEGVLAAQDTLLAWLDTGAFTNGAAPDSATWRIVPGHGSVVSRAGLAADHDALAALRRCARQAFDAGRSRAVAAADCAGVGFPGAGGAYAVWLFEAEWRTAKSAPATKAAKRSGKRGA